VILDEKTRRAIERLRGNPDYEQLMAYLREDLEERIKNLVYTTDSVATSRMQGRVAELRELLETVAP
jgi:hypothetical protein